MVRKAALAFALCLLAPSPALSADFVTGNDILATCTAADGSIDAAMCLGFIEGIMRRDDLTRWMKPEDAYLCEIPAGVTRGQARDIVVAYLRAHPERRHWNGTSSALMALKEALCR